MQQYMARQSLSWRDLGGTQTPMRISNSFSEGEIQVMEFIVNSLLRGSSPSMAVRNKDFSSLCRKVMAMKAKVIEKQIAAELDSKPVEASEEPAEQAPKADAALQQQVCCFVESPFAGKPVGLFKQRQRGGGCDCRSHWNGSGIRLPR